jgi:hypothetical protein
MTAGVVDDIADPAFARAYQADPAMALTPEQPLAIVREHPSDFTPGRRRATPTAPPICSA